MMPMTRSSKWPWPRAGARADELQCDVDYEETKNIGHVPPMTSSGTNTKRCAPHSHYTPKKSPSAPTVPTRSSPSDWVQSSMLRPGDDRKLFSARQRHMTITDNVYTLEADRVVRKLEVKTDNVESMRFTSTIR